MKQNNAIASVRTQLGKRIRELRVEQGFSQKAFALRIGMDRTYLVSVEHGRRNISLDNLVKIATGFGITLADLMLGIEIPAGK